MNVQIDMDASNPMGMLRPGFLTSSAMVETASKPKYAKNTTEAALKVPRIPDGRKKGVRFLVFACARPAIMMKVMMNMLTKDMIQLM